MNKYELYCSGVKSSGIFRGSLLIFKATDNRYKYFERINLSLDDNYDDTRELKEILSGKGLKNIVFWKRNWVQCKHCGSYTQGRKIPIPINKIWENA